MNTQTSATQSSKILLAALLACGVAGVVAVGWGWLAGVVSQWRTGSRISESLVITREGHALVESRNRWEHSAATFRTLDGEPLPANETAELNRSATRMLEDYVLPAADSSRERTLPWPERVCGFVGGGNGLAYWYLIHDGQPDGRAYLAGYDSRSKLAIGYMGPAGYRPDLPPREEQFVMDAKRLASEVACARAWWGSAPALTGNERYSPELAQLFLVSDGALYRVDLACQTVRAVPLPDPVVSINMASSRAADQIAESARDKCVLVRTTGQLVILNLHGETSGMARLPEAVRDQDISVYLPTTGDLILCVDAEDDPARKVLYRIGIDDDSLRQEEARLPRSSPPDLRRIAWSQAAMFPSPLVLSLVRIVVTPRNYVERYEAKSYPAALARSLSAAWPGILAMSIVAGVLAGFCYRHHARYADRGEAAWAVFVLLTGVPGAIGYRLHRQWPARECCGSCGLLVPRDREDCLSCAAEFPEPMPRGIEILA